MTKLELIKLSAGAIAGASVTCLVGAVTGKYVESAKGLAKVGCYIGAGLVGAWVTKEVTNMIDENIDGTINNLQRVANEVARRQEELKGKESSDDKDEK